ncbi:hypothetical protein PF005_g20541 [Phytophthora fragariae]|uniref:Uncharacterized protein n=1 Tax=Phytophthora fragariae TaxID=53985 RepID=A0A6A3JK87_9STRA|nr:hypothetical protein PF011_g16710 [Phytophthora fragariae]KAE9101034.1 hypothetical protein PF010_g14585 [Phytophthora fragariae]KAE9187219.1 hypothetical protein PF005_g20541 [Phytophthora fragariae]KAE9198179.1 hypothetical protein PF004_g19621 [Phytophthora fragariae]KAE9202194.1 hypothetical protein PF002_g21319 [Phytophthora fragariae]
MPNPVRRFVSLACGSRARSTHRRQGVHVSVTGHEIHPLQAGDVLLGPTPYREYLSDTYSASVVRVPELSADELSDASVSTEVFDNSEQENSELSDDEPDSHHSHHPNDKHAPAEPAYDTARIAGTSDDGVRVGPVDSVHEFGSASVEGEAGDTDISAPYTDVRRSGRRRQLTERARGYADSKRRRC